MELGNLVRFSTHPRPFRVWDTYCANPDCACQAVILTFEEIADSKQSSASPISFTSNVDLNSWQEKAPPQRSPQISEWVQEFLRKCPSARKAQFRSSYEEHKQMAKRKAECMLDVEDVLGGALISYCTIVTEQQALSEGGDSYTFRFYHEEREYLVEDRYCANPHCDCQAVHLEFFEVVSAGDGRQSAVKVHQRFLGKVTFAGQETVEQQVTCSLATARAVLSAWCQEWCEHAEMLKHRYAEVKEIGQRSLEAAPPQRLASLEATAGASIIGDGPADERPDANVRVGRNAPCPCGSGKKYKKCCWRGRAASV